MRGAAVAVLLLCILPAESATAAKPEKQGFAQRLAAGNVVFAQAPVEPLSVVEANENLNIVRIAEAEAVANGILARLIAVLPVPNLRQPTFFITSGVDFNCSVVKSGGAISCSHHVFEMLVAAGPRGRDQLAFLLAHELAHTVLPEHRKRFDRSDAVKSGWANAGALAGLVGLLALNKYSTMGSSTTVHPTMAANNAFFGMISAGADAGETVDGIVAPSWSRDNEAEADTFAIYFMQRAGFDPREAAQLLGTVDAEQRGLAKGSSNGLLKKAGDNLITQAVLSRGNPVSMGIGMGTGLLASIVTRGGKGHYHDATGKRASACAEQASGYDGGGAKPDEAKALFASAEAIDPVQSSAAPSMATVVAAPLPAARPSGRGGRRRSALKSPPVAVAAAPKDPWLIMVARSAAPLRELTLAVAVDQRRAGKDLNGALGLCPATRPLTRQLALSCGTAQVAANNGPTASALLHQAATDPTADAETFRRAAEGQAALGSGSEALATIEVGQRRYPDGQLFPAEIALRGGLEDRDGAKAAAQRCSAVSAKSIQEECRKALAGLETVKKG